MFGAFLTICVLVIATAAPADTGNDLIVIVNPGCTATNVSFADLQKIVRGEKSSFGGAPVQIVLLSSGPAHDAVLRDLANMDDATYKKQWVTMVFRNEASNEPLSLPSRGIVIDTVAVRRGAIGFVQNGNALNVKVLKVDGHLPGEAGYPLHF